MDGWMHQLISFYFMANHAVTNELHGGGSRVFTTDGWK
jgi:hypothetical protein